MPQGFSSVSFSFKPPCCKLIYARVPGLKPDCSVEMSLLLEKCYNKSFKYFTALEINNIYQLDKMTVENYFGRSFLRAAIYNDRHDVRSCWTLRIFFKS